MAYQPSANDIAALVRLLESGLSGTGQREAAATLEQFARSPQFCQLLAHVFGSTEPLGASTAPWLHIRQMAGLTLKNNVEKAHAELGGDAIKAAAVASMTILASGTKERGVLEPSCQVVSRITAIAGAEWWGSIGCDLWSVVIDLLLKAPEPDKALAGLRALQYLMEDAGGKVGHACSRILEGVAQVVVSHANPAVRLEALGVLSHPYELGRQLNWGYETMTPMQHGLVSAARGVAFTATQAMGQDGGSSLAARLRCCKLFLYLSEYFEYLIVGSPANDDQMKHCIQSWIQWSLQNIAALHQQAELASIGCDFINSIACTAAGVALEEQHVIHAIASMVEPHIDALVPILLEACLLQDDYVQSVMEKDDMRYRDLHPAKRFKRRFTEEEEEKAQHELHGDLRDAASELLDHLARMASARVFPVMMAQLQSRWTHADWRQQEAAVSALGCITPGCQSELLQGNDPQRMSQLVRHLLSLHQPTNNPFVVAAASWTLGKMLDWVGALAPQLFTEVLPTLLAAVLSRSKMVQQSVLTSIKQLLECREASPSVKHHLAQVFGTLNQCLQAFHTNSFSLLVDCYRRLWALLDSEQQFQQASAALSSELQTRSAEFIRTVSARYQNKDSNQHVHKEVFDVCRGLALGYQQFLTSTSSSSAVQLADTWLNMFASLRQWDISDDVELVMMPMYLLWLLSNAMIVDHYRTVHPRIVGLALELLEHSSGEVKGTSISILTDAVDYLGEVGVPSVAEVVRRLVPLFKVDQNPALTVEATGLLSHLVIVFGMSQPIATCASLLAQQLRSDATTAQEMTHLAQHLASMLTAAPNLFPLGTLAHLMELVRKTSNEDPYKDPATRGLVAAVQVAVAQQPAQAAQLVKPFVLLLVSWRGYLQPDVVPQVSNALQALQQAAPQLFHEALSVVGNAPEFFATFRIR